MAGFPYLYTLTSAYLEAEFLRTGEKPREEQIVTIDSGAVDSDVRRGILVVEKHVDAQSVYRTGGDSVRVRILPDPPTIAGQIYDSYGSTNRFASRLVYKMVTTDHVLVSDEAALIVKAAGALIPPALDGLAAEIVAKNVANNEAVAAKERAAAEEKTSRLRQEDEANQAKTAAREKLEADKAQWIAEHGSDALKRKTAAGYDCQRAYVRERAADELPDFTVDFDDNAQWKSRSCPGDRAFAVVETLTTRGYNAQVVWLTADTDGVPLDKPTTEDSDDYPDAYQPQREAVAVRQYLGKYTLIQTF